MVGKRGDLFRGGGDLFRGGFDPTLQKRGGIYSGGDLFRGGDLIRFPIKTHNNIFEEVGSWIKDTLYLKPTNNGLLFDLKTIDCHSFEVLASDVF